MILLSVLREGFVNETVLLLQLEIDEKLIFLGVRDCMREHAVLTRATVNQTQSNTINFLWCVANLYNVKWIFYP